MTAPRAGLATPFRIVDAMILVAATACAFAIARSPSTFNVFFVTGAAWEMSLFRWLHRLVPFPALWTLAVWGLARFRPRPERRRLARSTGGVAVAAAMAAVVLATVVSTIIHVAHVLQETRAIPAFFNHPIQNHGLPPFAGSNLEELGGAAVLGAWAAMAAGRRCRLDRSWIDRAGRALGVVWIAMMLVYVYGFLG